MGVQIKNIESVIFLLILFQLNLGSAKPSNLRAKFENFAKSSEEEDLKRTTEQKKLREEKDKRDRDEAAKRQVIKYFFIYLCVLHRSKLSINYYIF